MRWQYIAKNAWNGSQYHRRRGRQLLPYQHHDRRNRYAHHRHGPCGSSVDTHETSDMEVTVQTFVRYEAFTTKGEDEVSIRNGCE